MADKKEVEIFTLPEGRVINCALFEKEIYTNPKGEAGKPSYKIEIAFDPKDVEGEGTFEDILADFADEKWGEGAGQDFLDGKIRNPFLNGDKRAAKREKDDKPGDAYKGKVYIRPHTLFNRDGRDGPGGIAVWNDGADGEVGPIEPMNADQVYPGCYGKVAVTIGSYEDNQGDPCLMLYLSAFQKTNDGDKLMTPRDTSKLFEPVGRKKGGASKRRTRKG